MKLSLDMVVPPVPTPTASGTVQVAGNSIGLATLARALAEEAREAWSDRIAPFLPETVKSRQRTGRHAPATRGPRGNRRARGKGDSPATTGRRKSDLRGDELADEMRIDESLASARPFFSFEFFPPKSDEAMASLFATAATLRRLSPAFVSITYGAGGSTRTRTVDLAKRISTELGLTVMAHATCIGSTRDELRTLFTELHEAGIENIMALRGDAPKDGELPIIDDGCTYANELISMLSQEFSFCVGAACYPETHVEAPDADTDLANLVRKVEAGASFLITQLFFDNEVYFRFVARARRAGIRVPIIPGIMPITNYAQISRFTAMCGACIPARLQAALERRVDDPEAIGDLGVAYATLQCADLLERGAPGIHFYTLNKSPATRAVVSALLASDRWPTLTGSAA